MFEVGKTYKTVGGWPAKVIWKSLKPELLNDESVIRAYLTVVHKPNTYVEKIIQHWDNGVTGAAFAVNEAPLFDVPHPACLTLEEIDI